MAKCRWNYFVKISTRTAESGFHVTYIGHFYCVKENLLNLVLVSFLNCGHDQLLPSFRKGVVLKHYVYTVQLYLTGCTPFSSLHIYASHYVHCASPQFATPARIERRQYCKVEPYNHMNNVRKYWIGPN